jgi:hypothetical protein
MVSPTFTETSANPTMFKFLHGRWFGKDGDVNRGKYPFPVDEVRWMINIE